MKTILKALFVLIALSAVPVFAQSDYSDYEATKARAEAGDAGSQTSLGVRYSFRAKEGEQNGDEALRWFKLAADQNFLDAQFFLGLMYERGTGVERNDQEAVKWYRLAAEQGYANAQNRLGFMYTNGRGIAQTYQEALKWYRLAAEQGDSDAQYNLGVMYRDGIGVPQNNSRAYIWYSVAAAQGNTEAPAERDGIRNQLSPQALELAQAQATRCFESSFSDCGYSAISLGGASVNAPNSLGIILLSVLGALLLWPMASTFRANKNKLSEEADVMENNKPIALIDKWSVKLACTGIAMGILLVLSMGYTQIGFMIGFALPFAAIGGIIGLVIDLIKARKKSA